jgi:hypothetical protein
VQTRLVEAGHLQRHIFNPVQAIFYESLGQSYEAVEVHQCRLIVARVLGNASLFLEVQADLKRLFSNLGAFDLANLGT